MRCNGGVTVDAVTRAALLFVSRVVWNDLLSATGEDNGESVELVAFQ